jgi:hypothetical protein
VVQLIVFLAIQMMHLQIIFQGNVRPAIKPKPGMLLHLIMLQLMQ